MIAPVVRASCLGRCHNCLFHRMVNPWDQWSIYCTVKKNRKFCTSVIRFSPTYYVGYNKSREIGHVNVVNFPGLITSVGHQSRETETEEKIKKRSSQGDFKVKKKKTEESWKASHRTF